MVLRAMPVARAVAAMPDAVRLRSHVQSPRSLIKRRTNGFEPQRNGFLVDHPTTLSGSGRSENRPPPQGSGSALISGRRLRARVEQWLGHREAVQAHRWADLPDGQRFLLGRFGEASYLRLFKWKRPVGRRAA